uniref:GST N-terminal domain-containing protein n=1 Tax=Populus davidiana TaxID=266767 RepID=A0A6M2EZ94_9ROSI
MAAAALDKSVPEKLPPSLDATAEQPPLFDGTTKLYTCYTCPFAHRVWITRNFKGLQDEIKLVPLILQNRPAWYSEKVYPPNKVNTSFSLCFINASFYCYPSLIPYFSRNDTLFFHFSFYFFRQYCSRSPKNKGKKKKTLQCIGLTSFLSKTHRVGFIVGVV